MPSNRVNVLSTGLPELDVILGGGIPVGSLIMLVGAPGSGKTILIQQLCFLWAARQRQAMLLHSPYESPADEMVEGAVEASPSSSRRKPGRKDRSRKTSKALYFSTMSEPHDKVIEHIGQFDFFDNDLFAEHLRFLSLTAVMEEGLQKTGDLIVETTRREGAGLIAIDGFRALEGLANESEVRRFLYRLSAQLSLLGATTLISLERNLIKDAGSEGDLTIADGIIALNNRTSGSREYSRMEVHKLRGMNRLRGSHAYIIDQGGLSFFPRLETLVPRTLTPASDNSQNVRLNFDLSELDNMLHGGVPYSSSTLLAGSPGTGKTLLGLHFAAAGATRGEPTLFVGFHESRVQLLDKAARLGLALGSVEQGLFDVLNFAPVELEPDQVALQIRQRIEKMGVRRLVLDDLTELDRACNLEGRNNDFIAALMAYFKEQSITAIFNYTVSKLTGNELDLSNTSLAQLAENLLLLRRIEYKTRFYRTLSVLQMRDSDYDPHIRQITIQDGKGLTVLPEGKGEGGLFLDLPPELINS